MIRRYAFALLGFVMGIGFLFYSCQKSGVNDFIQVTHPFPDSSSDIRTVLKKTSFSLFSQAAARVHLDSLLPAGSYFTVFAPVDTAMAAAGLDQGHIASCPLDSLRKIVLFHVAQGSYGQGALSTATYNVEMRSLQRDITTDTKSASSIAYQQLLYVRVSDVLYINGERVGAAGDTAWTASNGFIWPIRTMLKAPSQNIWQIVGSRPELSIYRMAMQIDDSIYRANGFLPEPPFVPGAYVSKQVAGDSISFNWVVYDNLPNSQYYGYSRPTVFAPTNAAFEAAGIRTYQDILDYNSPVPNPGPKIDMNTWQTIWTYLPMDSLLKEHVIINAGNNSGVRAPYHVSLYNDLLFNPDINNGSFNTVDFWHIGNAANLPLPSPLLQFSGSNGTVNIKYRPDAPAAVLPADRNRHFLATNGAVYETDVLFIPHN